ncbi:hypothetical protein C2E23DRAFT_721964 [Lenzites betulinus]|nr:hypothetical protein C2E23DRAFT_721964 [Lenzites betulinus]
MTWSLSQSQLDEALDAAWSALSPDTEDILTNVDLLPAAKRSDALPYESEETPYFIVKDVPAHLTVEKLSAASVVPCLLCGEKMSLLKMRNHTGQHILWSLRGISDEASVLDVGVEPCGFCGREVGCKTQLVLKNGTYKVSSSCRYHYASMLYASAIKSTTTTSCTNVPIHCQLCPLTSSGQPTTIWKYNTALHLIAAHRNEAGDLPDIPPRLLVDMHISKVEESAMGIEDEWTERWREENDIPGSDDIEEAQGKISASAISKRGRAQSTAEVEQSRRKTARTG